MKQLFSYFLVVAFFNSCIVPYEFHPGVSDEYIVIDALVTNEFKQHEVIISKTYAIGSEGDHSIKEAEVSVLVNGNETILFTEYENGRYVSNENFAGVQGSTYQLFVKTKDGLSYQSSVSTMPASADIVNIYAQYAEQPSEDENRNISGMQFFIDNNASTTDAKYFRFEWSETWKIVPPYNSLFIYQGYQINDCFWNPYELRTIAINPCYKSSKSTDITIGTSVFNETKNLIEFPVRFVSSEVDILRTRYSILVKQFTVNEDTYTYYKRLKETNESSGTLFDKQKGAIVGNIYSLDDNFETVLGNFEVSSVSERRQFFDPNDFEEPFRKPKFQYSCGTSELVVVLPALIDSVMTMNAGLVIFDDPCPLIPGTSVTLGPIQCADCSYYASTVKPDFWID